MGDRVEFAKRLKKLRDKKGLSISQCAQALSVSPSTFRDWEYGRAITGEPYLKLAEILEVSLSELFGVESSELLNEIEEIELDLQSLLKRVKKIKCPL